MPTPKTPKVVLHERRRAVPAGLKLIDLFCGGGGMAEGFRQAGFAVLAANDVDVFAGETFRLNFAEAAFFEGPLSGVDPEALLRAAGVEREELDCLVGGPPCQSFSYNNHQRSATDERAQLFRHYLKIVDALLPKTLIMENVPGMLTIGDGRIVEEIEDCLEELGYETAVRILYAEDLGVPQARRRVFVVASRIGDPEMLFPDGTHGPSVKPLQASNAFVHHWSPPAGQSALPFISVWDAIGDLPVLKNGETYVGSHTKEPRTGFQRALRGRTALVHNHGCHLLADVMLRRIKHIPAGGNWRDIPRGLLPAGMKRALTKDHTKRYGRIARSSLSSTILTKCDPHWGAYVHPTQHRTISVREAARLQGFPDRFRFAGEFLGKQYAQVGNAVPVPVALAIANAVVQHVAEAGASRQQCEPAMQQAPSSASGSSCFALPSELCQPSPIAA